MDTSLRNTLTTVLIWVAVCSAFFLAERVCGSALPVLARQVRRRIPSRYRRHSFVVVDIVVIAVIFLLTGLVIILVNRLVGR